jgi:hypothetical protein
MAMLGIRRQTVARDQFHLVAKAIQLAEIAADYFSIFPIVDTMKKVPFFARAARATISGKHFTNFHV